MPHVARQCEGCANHKTRTLVLSQGASLCSDPGRTRRTLPSTAVALHSSHEDSQSACARSPHSLQCISASLWKSGTGAGARHLTPKKSVNLPLGTHTVQPSSQAFRAIPLALPWLCCNSFHPVLVVDRSCQNNCSLLRYAGLHY